MKIEVENIIMSDFKLLIIILEVMADSLYKQCAGNGVGDDDCREWFGVLGNSTTSCCWKTQVIEVPAPEGNRTQAMITTYQDQLKAVGFPSTASDQALFVCVNHWN